MDNLHSLFILGKTLYLTLFIVGVGLIAFYVVAHGLYRSISAKRSWSSTEGTVIRSEIELLDSYSGDPECPPDDCRYPVLEYAYEAGGQQYQSRRFDLFGALPKLKPDDIMAIYPKGAKVTVYYNPAKPSDCALDCKLPAQSFRNSVLMIGAVLLVWIAWFSFLAELIKS